MPWKVPNRPSHSISQTYNSGIVRIYSVTDVARPGYAAQEQLSYLGTLSYEEQRLGIQRYYQGRQNQIEVERVVRVQRAVPINNQDIAVTEDGRQYRIDLVQSVADVYPPSVDLTLAKITQGANLP